MERIELLCRNPRSGKRMVGRGDLYRDRVGSYRIVYSIKDDVRSISIVRIGLRKGVYRGSIKVHKKWPRGQPGSTHAVV